MGSILREHSQVLGRSTLESFWEARWGATEGFYQMPLTSTLRDQLCEITLGEHSWGVLLGTTRVLSGNTFCYYWGAFLVL